MGHRSAARWLWTAVAVALYTLLAVVVVVGNHDDPAIFIHFGHGGNFIPLARHDFGPKVPIPLADGQDGQTFWVLARDPALLHPRDVLETMDRPAYRAQRIGYPALAAPGRVFGTRGLAWSLVIVNLVAVGVGAAAAGEVVASLGLRRAASLAWTLNPAVAIAVLYDTADAVALSMLFVVVWAVRTERWTAAVAAGVLGVLAKEPTLLAVAGVGLAATGARTGNRLRLVLIPGATAVCWGIYERARLGWPPSQIQEFAAPLGGYLEALRRGWIPTGDIGNAMVALAVLILASSIVWMWWRDRSNLLLCAALPYAVLVPFLSGQVLDLSTNSLRAVGAAPTFAGILYLQRRARDPVGHERA